MSWRAFDMIPVKRQQKSKQAATHCTNSWNFSSLLFISKLPSVSLTT